MTDVNEAAVIELEADDDVVQVSGRGRDWIEGIVLDQSPDGIFSTEFTTRTVSGAFQVGGRAVGHDIPIRKMVLPFHLFENGSGLEPVVSRFRKLWRMGRTITWRYTAPDSLETRTLKVRLSKEVTFAPSEDPHLQDYVHAVVEAIAVQPMYEGAEHTVSAVNPSAGTNTVYLPGWNPADNECWLEWSFDPATSITFPDYSFGQERKWRRPAGADAARAITTPKLTQRLSVMADPMMDTYISGDLSNAAGLFNGVEPMYAVPPYTGSRDHPVIFPVVINGPAGTEVSLTMRRFWSAEEGLW